MVVAAACAWLLLGGTGDRRYVVRLADAGQLVKGDLVRLAGRTVGEVREVRLADDRRAEVVLAIEEDAGPLRRGTRVAVRAASLTGVANRYLALTPGPPAAPALREGTTLPAAAVTPLVELDEVVSAFDPQTREGLRGVVRGTARQLDGRGAQANAAAENLDPALHAVRGLAEDVAADDATLRRFVASSARVMRALGSRRDALAGAVGETATALEAVAGADAALDRALARAPRALRSTTAGLAELRRAVPDLDALLTTADDVEPQLTALLRDVRPALAAAQPVLADLRPAVTAPGAADDLTDLLRGLPRLASTAGPALRATSRALDESQEVVRFARPYAPDLVGLLRDLGQSTAAYDANGHYARVQPVFNAFQTDAAGALVPRTGSRLAGFETLQVRRCPGGASSPRADGSAPWRDADGTLDCDPSTSPGTP